MRLASSSTLQPDLRTRCQSSMRHRRAWCSTIRRQACGGVGGEGGEQQPADRRGAFGRAPPRRARPADASAACRGVRARWARPGRAGRLLRFGRAVRRSTWTTARAHAGAARSASSSDRRRRRGGGRWRAPARPAPAARRASNTRKSLASRSITLTTRPGPNSRASSAQSRRASIQRSDAAHACRAPQKDRARKSSATCGAWVALAGLSAGSPTRAPLGGDSCPHACVASWPMSFPGGRQDALPPECG